MPGKHRGLLDQRAPHTRRGGGSHRQCSSPPRLEPQAQGKAVLEERALREAASEAGHHRLCALKVALDKHQQYLPHRERRAATRGQQCPQPLPQQRGVGGGR